jgi:hypothetical protein
VLKGRKETVLLVGLVLLLGVQLTGLTCLGEQQIGSAVSFVEALDLSPSPHGAVTDDGCPCHVLFQSVSPPAPDIISPFADDVILNSTLYVPTFVKFLFHPPLSL